MKCKLCSSENVTTIYNGPIRSGGVDSGFTDGFEIKKCESCHVEFLEPFPDNLKDFYETERYWASRQGEIEIKKIQKKLDPEQLRWLDEMGTSQIRRKRVADFGCGAGLFLDLVKGIASETVGIDLASHFSQHLMANGHRYEQNAGALEDEWLDMAVSFDTLEHQESPLEFLRSIWKTLKPGGSFFIGVPNQNDFLKKIVPDYLPFFYHTSHLFYFTSDTLSHILKESGFQVCNVRFVHKYDLMNLVLWAREGKGNGKKGSDLFDPNTEDAFRSHLERQGIASHIFVETCK